MQIGALLDRLEAEDDALTALEALGDIVLFAEVQRMGALFDETPGAYVSGAVGRFAASGDDEAWMQLIGQLERSADPMSSALRFMLRWALTRDAAESGPQTAHACGCGGAAGGCGDHA